MVETVQHPTAGSLNMLGIPFKLAGTPPSIRRAPPTLGQHADEILHTMLGFNGAQIAELCKNKTI